MLKNNISDFSKCSNCGACYNICPVQAIDVNQEDVFYQVKVNETKCINCGLCKKVCPVNTPKPNQSLFSCYAAVNCNSDVLRNSSSGGVFSAIADYCLAKGGVVFGAAYSNNFRTVEIKSTDEVDLSELRRSKYVESLVGDSFKKVKQYLKQQKPVLYCGAPCQIAGLKRFLNEDYENLITCDFSCGGMASHQFYKEYIDYIEQKLNARITEVNFRPKVYGWQKHAMLIKAENQKKYCRPSICDPYFLSYIHERLNIRDYCYECSFGNNHSADFILADLWKWRDFNVVNNDRGLSLILTNSLKGERILKEISKTMSITVLDFDRATYNVSSRNINPTFMEKRKAFLEDCNKQGFIKTMKRHKHYSLFIFLVKYYLKKALQFIRG